VSSFSRAVVRHRSVFILVLLAIAFVVESIDPGLLFDYVGNSRSVSTAIVVPHDRGK